MVIAGFVWCFLCGEVKDRHPKISRSEEICSLGLLEIWQKPASGISIPGQDNALQGMRLLSQAPTRETEYRILLNSIVVISCLASLCLRLIICEVNMKMLVFV